MYSPGLLGCASPQRSALVQYSRCGSTLWPILTLSAQDQSERNLAARALRRGLGRWDLQRSDTLRLRDREDGVSVGRSQPCRYLICWQPLAPSRSFQRWRILLSSPMVGLPTVNSLTRKISHPKNSRYKGLKSSISDAS